MVPELRGGSFSAPDRRASMATLTRLLENGELRVVVDRAFPLARAPEALEYLASGRAVGWVVVAVHD